MRMRRNWVWIAVGVMFWGLLASENCPAAEYTTRNFRVNAPTDEVAKKVGEAAEFFRKEIAIEWLGHELPRWSQRCPIKVKVGQIGAGGETTFNFHPVSNAPAEVCDWNMKVQGSLERILDSVIPHEVSHTIFACHFRRPLPRWADEGAATLVECESERRIQVLTVEEVMKTRRRIPFKQLLGMKDYPKDPQAVRTLYAEGYSLAELLVQEGGKAKYLLFLDDANRAGWDKAISKHYPYAGVDGLENRWKDWVMAGSPEISRNPQTLLADAGVGKAKITRGEPDRVTVRGQSPESDQPAEKSVERSKLAGRNSTKGRDNETSRLAAPAPKRKTTGARLGDDEESDEDVGAERVAELEPAPKTRELPRRTPKTESEEPTPPKRNSRELARADDRASEADLGPIANSFDDEMPSRRRSSDEESAPTKGRNTRGRMSESRDQSPAKPKLLASQANGVERGRRVNYSEFPDDARPQVTLLPNDLR